jgi:peptidoglycan/LPS O-acetylase OafA/YrhL
MIKILEIQGLRALAVILVIVYHADFISGGFIGVDIFYVISGFLITNLIIKEISTKGNLNLRNFYHRRIKRLLPASALVLLVTALTCYILLPPMDRDQLGKDVIAVSLLLSNYAFAIWENDYQNLGEAASPFIHYWSLAVEEQFYLIWRDSISVLITPARDLMPSVIRSGVGWQYEIRNDQEPKPSA